MIPKLKRFIISHASNNKYLVYVPHLAKRTKIVETVDISTLLTHLDTEDSSEVQRIGCGKYQLTRYEIKNCWKEFSTVKEAESYLTTNYEAIRQSMVKGVARA